MEKSKIKNPEFENHRHEWKIPCSLYQMSKKYKKIPQDGPLSKKRKPLLTVVTNVKNLSKIKFEKKS